MAIVRDGQILLVRRLRHPEAGCWGIAGGKVDWLEPVEAAARREIGEELGLELGALSLLCVVDQIDAAGAEHWVSPVYLAEAFNGEPRNLEPEKHDAMGWFALSAPPSPLTAAARTALATLGAPAARRPFHS